MSAIHTPNATVFFSPNEKWEDGNEKWEDGMTLRCRVMPKMETAAAGEVCPGCDSLKQNVEFKTCLSPAMVGTDVLVCEDCFNEIEKDDEDEKDEEDEDALEEEEQHNAYCVCGKQTKSKTYCGGNTCCICQKMTFCDDCCPAQDKFASHTPDCWSECIEYDYCHSVCLRCQQKEEDEEKEEEEEDDEDEEDSE